MNPEHNKERRLARAKALVDLHAREEGAVYVDAAEYQGSSGASAAVVVGASTGATKTAASVRTREAHRAEEVAIALTVSNPGCCVTLERQSKTTPRVGYERGRAHTAVQSRRHRTQKCCANQVVPGAHGQ
ncbi:hypothetical protein MTO96_000275 [Rhipicephalus appendiculatus]